MARRLFLFGFSLLVGCGGGGGEATQVGTVDGNAVGLDAVLDTAAEVGPDATPDAASDAATETTADTGPEAGPDTVACAGPCDDGNPCTDDTCTPAGTCAFTPNSKPCDDGDTCTGPDVCQGGKCLSGGPICGSLVPQGVGASPCQLQGNLPDASAVELVPWFTKLGLQQPTQIVTFPDDSDRLVWVQRTGKLHLFDNKPDVATSKQVLDIEAKVSTAGEGGLLSVAFHPKFKQNKKLYVNYTSSGPKFDTYVVEYVLGPDEVAIPASARTLLVIPQPYSNHNGGQLFFDNAGFLLIGMGDGGGGGDPLKTGQDKQHLLGKILRIDVEPAGGKPYGIPADNPFAGNPAYKPEIFALGLRNPWRFTVDRLTGQIWAGDVGQGLWEEVDLIESGKNYGWNVMEGAHCYSPQVGCNQTGLTPPVGEYPHTQGSSITGGYVYRGSAQKSLYSKYLFGDFGSGRLWSLAPKTGGGWQMTELAKTSVSIVAFGEDNAGELYALQLFGPALVYKIVEKTVKPPEGQALPLLLSQTGCFAKGTLQPAPGVVPYDVNAPLWSDGAAKQRFLVLPKGAVLQPKGQGPLQPPADDLAAWDLPVGTLVIKHFAVGADGKVPVETRFLRRDPQGWAYFTYRWKPDGSDAELLPGGGGTTTYPGGVKWTVPTLAQCRSCHRPSASGSELLGLQTAQLHRLVTYPGGKSAPQLTVWNQAGLLGDPAWKTQAHQALPPVGEVTAKVPAADVPAHARAYLHGNCSHCHRPGGGNSMDLDLRYGVSLQASKVCGKPQAGDLAGKAQAIVQPGQPSASALWLRLNATPGSPDQMPPVGVGVSHAGAVQLVADWISGLQTCP